MGQLGGLIGEVSEIPYLSWRNMTAGIARSEGPRLAGQPAPNPGGGRHWRVHLGLPRRVVTWSFDDSDLLEPLTKPSVSFAEREMEGSLQVLVGGRLVQMSQAICPVLKCQT